MKIYEVIAEQTIGTTGSTTGTPGQVSPVSQPGQPDDPNEPKTDPNTQKLAATLKQNNIVSTEKDINDFMGAWQAQQGGKTLNPDQQEILAKLGPALLKNKNLDSQLDLQLKSMSQVKPGQQQQTPAQGNTLQGTPK